MKGIVILLIVIVGTALLGRYALIEGQRIEDRKKFMKNLNNDHKKNKK